MCSEKTGFKCKLRIKNPSQFEKAQGDVLSWYFLCPLLCREVCDGFIIGLCFSDSLISFSCKEAEILTKLGDFSAE